jgi:pyridoxine 5-phosphate synthase
MTKLSVNVNKVALLRNTRNLNIPSVTRAAAICVQAGAQGITVHPRPDQRHIRPSDVDELSEMLSVEFNIEGNPFSPPAGAYPGFMQIVRRVKPTQCTLVPDAPGQVTSDHGWNLRGDTKGLKDIIKELRDRGIRVSLFMDPVCEQIRRAADLGPQRIELYTEPYARAFNQGQVDASLAEYARAAECAQEAGLGVNAGHDLSLQNLRKFVTIPGILEVSIGHALIAEALEMGLAETVKAYLRILASAP